MSTMSTKTPPGKGLGRRQPITPIRAPSPAARTPASASNTSANGLGRTTSIKGGGMDRPARPAGRRPGMGSREISGNGESEDARAEDAALLQDLQNNLHKAESASEDYQRQLVMLQERLDDAVHEQSKLEIQVHEGRNKIEEVDTGKREVQRQLRVMENIHESEKAAMLRDREEYMHREIELNSIVQRQKETLAARELRRNVEDDSRRSRSPNLQSRSGSVDENGQFAPPSSLQRGDSKSNSRLVMQKDRIIESLRLELAEAQIKLVEMENQGGGRMQDLEKVLLETRMTNARLMEDNESFQLLLHEKTMNGDFSKAPFMSTPSNESSGLGSLAEELESAQDESDNYRRLEAEMKSLRDQNKALTLYVEKIISRVLQHDNFETILDKGPDPVPKSRTGSIANDMPPPVPMKDEDASQSMLQRAKSVVGGGSRRPRPMSQYVNPAPVAEQLGNDGSQSGLTRRPRPMSQMMSTVPPAPPSANHDPITAPSIPIGRSQSIRGSGHRRTSSDMTNAANVVNHMYKGPPPGANGPTSPSISPGIGPPRTSFFQTGASSRENSSGAANTHMAHPASSSRGHERSRDRSGSRAPSDQHPASSNNSTFSKDSAERETTTSPPRNPARNSIYTGAVMTQNQLRPLRLVQENKEMDKGPQGGVARFSGAEEAARKKANRGSWMGWFNRGADEGAPQHPPGAGLQTPNAPPSGTAENFGYSGYTY